LTFSGIFALEELWHLKKFLRFVMLVGLSRRYRKQLAVLFYGGLKGTAKIAAILHL
jgi:hypothetical protein